MLTNEELDTVREMLRLRRSTPEMDFAVVTQAREANALRAEVERLRTSVLMFDAEIDRVRARAALADEIAADPGMHGDALNDWLARYDAATKEER